MEKIEYIVTKPDNKNLDLEEAFINFKKSLEGYQYLCSKYIDEKFVEAIKTQIKRVLKEMEATLEQKVQQEIIAGLRRAE